MCLFVYCFITYLFNNPHLLFSVSRGHNHSKWDTCFYKLFWLRRPRKSSPTVISVTHVSPHTDVTMANFLFTNSATENTCSRIHNSFFTNTTYVQPDHNTNITNTLKKYMIHKHSTYFQIQLLWWWWALINTDQINVITNWRKKVKSTKHCIIQEYSEF